jgi:hypothetical protein
LNKFFTKKQFYKSKRINNVEKNSDSKDLEFNWKVYIFLFKLYSIWKKKTLKAILDNKPLVKL